MNKKLPKLWRRKRGGKEFGAFYVEIGGKRLNLATQNAEIARQRRTEAMRGKRTWKDDLEGAADATIAAFERAPDAKTSGVVDARPAEQPAFSDGGSPPPPAFTGNAEPAAQPLLIPEVIDDGRGAAGWADDANAAAGAASTEPPKAAPEVSVDELAQLGVAGQVWLAAWRAKQKVYRGFVAPPLPDEGKAELAKPWKTLIEYVDVGAVLPPWVTGIVVPVISITTATVALAAFFAEAAEQQRKAAGAPRADDSSNASVTADAA